MGAIRWKCGRCGAPCNRWNWTSRAFAAANPRACPMPSTWRAGEMEPMRTLNPTGRTKADGKRAAACAGVFVPPVILLLGWLLVAGEAFAQPFSEHRDTR